VAFLIFQIVPDKHYSGCAGNASRSRNKWREREAFSPRKKAFFDGYKQDHSRKAASVSQMHNDSWPQESSVPL